MHSNKVRPAINRALNIQREDGLFSLPPKYTVSKIDDGSGRLAHEPETEIFEVRFKVGSTSAAYSLDAEELYQSLREEFPSTEFYIVTPV